MLIVGCRRKFFASFFRCKENIFGDCFGNSGKVPIFALAK